jgi:hypothetical protein
MSGGGIQGIVYRGRIVLIRRLFEAAEAGFFIPAGCLGCYASL